MKNKIYFFDSTCNSAHDEYLEICDLRQKNGLSKISFESFVNRCNRPNELQLEEWQKQYPKSKFDFVFCYTEKQFLED